MQNGREFYSFDLLDQAMNVGCLYVLQPMTNRQRAAGVVLFVTLCSRPEARTPVTSGVTP